MTMTITAQTTATMSATVATSAVMNIAGEAAAMRYSAAVVKTTPELIPMPDNDKYAPWK